MAAEEEETGKRPTEGERRGESWYITLSEVVFCITHKDLGYRSVVLSVKVSVVKVVKEKRHEC